MDREGQKLPPPLRTGLYRLVWKASGGEYTGVHRQVHESPQRMGAGGLDRLRGWSHRDT